MKKRSKILSLIANLILLSSCSTQKISSSIKYDSSISQSINESSTKNNDSKENSQDENISDVISESNNEDKPILSVSSSSDEISNSEISSSDELDYEEVLDTTGFTFIEKADGYYISGYDSSMKSTCVLPTKYNDKNVVGVLANAFKDTSTIKELVISYTVKVIEESAFEKCSNLEKITLNSQVKLNSKAFYKCFALKEITHGTGGFTYIGEYSFYNCGNLATLNFSLSSKLEKIDSYAFYNCRKLANTSMPSSLKEIGIKAFYHCNSFKTLLFKNESELTTIREAAFEYCINLENVYLPYKLETLENNPFGYCPKLIKFNILAGPNSESGKYMSYLKNGSYTLIERDTYDLVINPSGKSSLDGIKLSDKTTKIKPYAFRGCNHLANIEIPESINEIGENAFFGVEGAVTINIPKANKYYSYDAYGFYNYDKTEFISYTNFGSSNKVECIIPETVEVIKDYAFLNAQYLTKIILKNKDTVISSNALAGSIINEIYIEETNETYTVDNYIYNYKNTNSINNYLDKESTYLDLSSEENKFTQVGDYAFNNKTNLEYIIFNENVNTFGNYVFNGTNANLIIYLNICKEDLNENISKYWNDGREVYYKDEWKLIDNAPSIIK